MTRRLIAAVLATAMTFTSFAATPVRAADSGEIGRFLLGAGALFIIGSALANQNRHDQGYVSRPHVYEPHRPGARPPGKLHRKNVVPAKCLRVNHSGQGPRRFFDRYCLSRHMRHANRLPDSCLRHMWVQRQPRSVYAAPCLRSHGFVFG